MTWSEPSVGVDGLVRAVAFSGAVARLLGRRTGEWGGENTLRLRHHGFFCLRNATPNMAPENESPEGVQRE